MLQAYLVVNYELSGEKIKHTRIIYDLLALFGDFGGLYGLLLEILVVIFAPWTEFLYLNKLIEKLYWVKTKDEGLFRETNK